MFYAFNKKTLLCEFSCSARFGGMGDYIVVESKESNLNITEITVKGTKVDGISVWTIVDLPVPESRLVDEFKVRRSALLRIAQDHITMLDSIITMSDDAAAKVRLTEWMQFRLAVYKAQYGDDLPSTPEIEL